MISVQHKSIFNLRLVRIDSVVPLRNISLMIALDTESGNNAQRRKCDISRNKFSEVGSYSVLCEDEKIAPREGALTC